MTAARLNSESAMLLLPSGWTRVQDTRAKESVTRQCCFDSNGFFPVLEDETHGHVIKKRDKREKRGERVNARSSHNRCVNFGNAGMHMCCGRRVQGTDCGFPDFFRHLGLHASRTDIRVPWSTWTCESEAANLFRHASYTSAATNYINMSPRLLVQLNST